MTSSLESVAVLSSRHGVQALSLVMILISCTGIFLPLEVALNQAWGVTKSRNYLINQLVAFGLAILMVGLAMASILLSAGQRQVLGLLFFHHTDNFVFRGSQLSLAHAVHRGWRRFCSSFRSTGFLPNRRIPARQVLRTSVITGIIWLRRQVHLCCGAAASRSEGALRPVLCFGGIAVLGVCFRTDSVCRCAVQCDAALGTKRSSRNCHTARVRTGQCYGSLKAFTAIALGLRPAGSMVNSACDAVRTTATSPERASTTKADGRTRRMPTPRDRRRHAPILRACRRQSRRS